MKATSRVTTTLLLLVAGCADGLRIELPEPTGDRELDLAVVSDALVRVDPGSTIAFGPGTYRIGSEGLTLSAPEVTLLGHPDGTTLLGCSEDELSTRPFRSMCRGILLAAEAQRVFNLRFEAFSVALELKPPADDQAVERATPYTGGHLIEGNAFHNSSGFEVGLIADSTVVIRGNVFRNTYHALTLEGRNIHVIDNDISAPEPELIPDGHPGGAVALASFATATCDSILVEGNRIDGHSEAVLISNTPFVPGAGCSGITVRNNEITMRLSRTLTEAWADPRGPMNAGKFAIAPAIRIANAQRMLFEGVPLWGQAMAPEGGWPPAFMESQVSDILVEGNRISGAVGIGIEIAAARNVRVIGNDIDVRPAVTPDELEGLSVGGNMRSGIWVLQGLLEKVNGSPVWVSEDSEDVVVEAPR